MADSNDADVVYTVNEMMCRNKYCDYFGPMILEKKFGGEKIKVCPDCGETQ